MLSHQPPAVTLKFRKISMENEQNGRLVNGLLNGRESGKDSPCPDTNKKMYVEFDGYIQSPASNIPVRSFTEPSERSPKPLENRNNGGTIYKLQRCRDARRYESFSLSIYPPITCGLSRSWDVHTFCDSCPLSLGLVAAPPALRHGLFKGCGAHRGNDKEIPKKRPAPCDAAAEA